MFKVIRVRAYDHAAEEAQFDALRLMLASRYASSESSCLLLGNVNIEGVELDALLFAPGMVRVIEFKNYGGSITACENGAWLSSGGIIAGGSGKTPFEQARVNRSRVRQGLEHRTHVRYHHISVAIVFSKPSVIDTTLLSATTKKWLTLCDSAHLEELLHGGGVDIDNAAIDQLPRQLGLDCPEPVVPPYVMTPEELFTNLRRSACLSSADWRGVYQIYATVFSAVLNQGTATTTITFTGAYAKTDYLLKEHGAATPLVRGVNALRIRLDAIAHGDVVNGEPERYRYNDLEALSRFVALVYGTPVPSDIAAAYAGRTVAPSAVGEVRGDCMRVMVSRWDDTYLYGHPSDGDGVTEVTISYMDDGYGNAVDRSYLRDLLYEGASVNLVPPIEQDGILRATFIVFEPDCLIGVQTIARCFTEYADSPLVALISRLTPVRPSDAVTLGNFAGLLLDKALRADQTDYNSCVWDFYRDNALSFLDLDNAGDFHEQARSQMANIEHVVNATLPGNHSRFDKRAGMVEPSFFSEMLGLQGRMDYLQLDFKLLMEQKSGKGRWPDGYPHRPSARREHLVQLLLYMLIVRYNYRAVYKANNEELHAYLLYSKYEEPLVPVNFIPRVEHEAMRVRNELAGQELRCSREGGYDILAGMTPETLNEKQATGWLWVNSHSPQIASVLDPIQRASELERSYFLRYLTFVSHEQLLSKLGNKSKECSGFASAWHDTLQAKLAAGNIYVGLRLVEPTREPSGDGIRMVRLTYTESADHVMSNFRKGDIVVLYPYEAGRVPDLRATMVFRSTIDSITGDTIALKLRSPQSDARAFEAKRGRLWAIEHDYMESSSASLYRGLHALLSAPRERRDLLLLQREPLVDTTVMPVGDYGCFNDMVRRVRQARDLFLIIGPPGTGKTSFGMLYNVKEELLASPTSSVLLLSYTNRAVDEICGKLEREGIDYLRIGNEESCDEAYRERLLSAQAAKTTNVRQTRELIATTRVVVATTASLNSRVQLLAMKSFSLCIVDEASQILEPHLVGILAACCKGRPAVGKVVLIGDQKQLPAVVQQDKRASAVTQALLNDIGLTDCRDSLFERLLRRYGHRPDVTYMLTRHGRMHADIALFVSTRFYDSRLETVSDRQCAPLPPATGCEGDALGQMLLTRRVAFVDTALPSVSESMKVNDTEAAVIARTTLLAYRHTPAGRFIPGETIGIIVPYRNQIATVRQAIERQALQDSTLTDADRALLAAITIDTVERFQGSQREWIVYGLTVQRPYQLSFLTDSTYVDSDGRVVDRKLNVAVSRAKENVVIVGHAPLVARVPTISSLIDFARARGGYMRLY